MTKSYGTPCIGSYGNIAFLIVFYVFLKTFPLIGVSKDCCFNSIKQSILRSICENNIWIMMLSAKLFIITHVQSIEYVLAHNADSTNWLKIKFEQKKCREGKKLTHVTWSREMSHLSKISIPIFLHHFLITPEGFILMQTPLQLNIWLQSYEELVNAKNNIKERNWNTVFANISKPISPTSNLVLLIMFHICQNVYKCNWSCMIQGFNLGMTWNLTTWSLTSYRKVKSIWFKTSFLLQ